MSIYQQGDPEKILNLTGLIDEGSVGAVFAAEYDKQLLAVKVVPMEVSEIKSEVENEILMLKKCANGKSAYIVGFIGAWLKDDHAWIALELCEAGSVIDLVQICNHTLTADEARSVCASTLLGINHLHGLGIVHRDVKGKNVLLTRAGRVKLADLGVAFDTTSSVEPEPAGSPHWMAPESANGERPQFSNDVWAVGIMLIELIEGSPPHSSIPPLKVLEVVRNAPPPILRKVPAWGPQLGNLIHECLTKDAKARPTAKELLTHPFVDTEIMKALIAGAASVALKRLVEMSLPKIKDYHAFIAMGGEDDADLLATGDSSTVRMSTADDRPRDSIVRVEMSLEDKLRQQNMDLLFNLAQRYSLRGGITTSFLSAGEGTMPASNNTPKHGKKQRPKSVKITKLKTQFPRLDAQLHEVGVQFKKVLGKLSNG